LWSLQAKPSIPQQFHKQIPSILYNYVPVELIFKMNSLMTSHKVVLGYFVAVDVTQIKDAKNACIYNVHNNLLHTHLRTQ
jgi:hypothetical protein